MTRERAPSVSSIFLGHKKESWHAIHSDSFIYYYYFISFFLAIHLLPRVNRRFSYYKSQVNNKWYSLKTRLLVWYDSWVGPCPVTYVSLSLLILANSYVGRAANGCSSVDLVSLFFSPPFFGRLHLNLGDRRNKTWPLYVIPRRSSLSIRLFGSSWTEPPTKLITILFDFQVSSICTHIITPCILPGSFYPFLVYTISGICIVNIFSKLFSNRI